MKNFDTILLAYDGSEEGRVALRRSLPLLHAGEVTTHLLAVVPLTGAVAAAEGFYTESMYQSERERVERILAEGVAMLEAQGVAAEGVIRVGEPAHQIAKFAAEHAIDLVVVGHSKRGVLSRWWQGSVGASLLDRLDCSLLIAQDPGSEPPEA
ncbi:universal stress protein [Salinisphaera sp. Q1T1-3]|uniref:universal stress protein n=1 Tax=Salinisphaera sp. Q1T1-3 TaxID=2321229 RepID=UPI000E73CB6B|nr:universal stress protein [Salinisphaera sp. Q1T1-3]RJS94307.1 universal stress protein [Salinisphaera sp. Q1T1-3]